MTEGNTKLTSEQQVLAEAPKTTLAVGQGIALIIRTAQQAIAALGITERDLEAYSNTMTRYDAIGFALDPTGYRDFLYGERDELIQRMNLVSALLPAAMALPFRGEGLIGSHVAPMFNVHSEIQGYLVAPVEEDAE